MAGEQPGLQRQRLVPNPTKPMLNYTGNPADSIIQMCSDLSGAHYMLQVKPSALLNRGPQRTFCERFNFRAGQGEWAGGLFSFCSYLKLGAGEGTEPPTADSRQNAGSK